MTAPKDRFWAKVLFKEFIRHYRKLNDEQIVEDVKQSMDDLDDLNEDGESFGSKMVKWSTERKNQYPQAAMNGAMGGRPRNNPQNVPQQLKPPTISEVYEFALEHKIWDDFAREWYERNYKDRDGVDKEGHVILNWKGALTNDWKKNKDNYQRRMQG